MKNKKISRDNFPEADIKIESVDVKSRIRYVPYVVVNPPYMILSDKDGTRKIWTNNKWKIFLYYAWNITRIKWFLKKYQQR